MKFPDIDMQGNFRAQMIIDVSALIWTSDDERRIVYDETTEQLWIADSSDWKSIGRYNNIPENTQMWIYADSPPDGWTLNGAVSEVLTAVKGGGTYVTGGVVAGNFTTPAHAHGLTGHSHSASGAIPVAPDFWIHRDSETGTDSSTLLHTHSSATVNSIATGTVTGIDGADSGYRPRARVGIICIR
jgi:hypothetical protein